MLHARIFKWSMEKRKKKKRERRRGRREGGVVSIYGPGGDPGLSGSTGSGSENRFLTKSNQSVLRSESEQKQARKSESDWLESRQDHRISEFLASPIPS